MKKIKYYETEREKANNQKFRFRQFEGYLKEFYNSETDSIVNVVFRRDARLEWKATHLESGILIVSCYPSRKACIDGLMVKLNAVAKAIQHEEVKKIIDELEKHRNKELKKHVIA